MAMLRVIGRKVRTAARFNRTQWLWVLPVYVLSGVMRLAILVLPFRWVARYLGQHNGTVPMTALTTEAEEHFARQMGSMIQAICGYTPWESKCLVQAMLARLVLGWYGIPHVILLGVNRRGPAEQPMNAHAWVTSGRCFVTGGRSYRQFGVVASFVNGVDLPHRAGLAS